MKADKDNKEYAARDLRAAAARLARLASAIEKTGAEVCRMDALEPLTTEARECSHAWYFANEYGGFILCTDERNEGDAIEAFGDYFLEMHYMGLIHEPADLLESYTQDEIDEIYYPYNGGQMYMDMPVVLEMIY